MKAFQFISYLLVALIVGVTLYSHLLVNPEQFNAPASTIFHNKGNASHLLIHADMKLHRPPVRALDKAQSMRMQYSKINSACNNQSSCFPAELQVTKQFSIYLCKKVGKHGSRFYYLLSDGLAKHPAVTVIEDITSADFIFYLPGSAPWHKSECTDTILANKLIVLDEFDGSFAFSPRKTNEELKLAYPDKIIDNTNIMWYFMYFKRSYVHRKDGKFIRYPFLRKKDFFPMVYSIADSYVRPQYNANRRYLVTCTLRGDPKYQPSRLRTLDWIQEYVNIHKLPPERVITAQV